MTRASFRTSGGSALKREQAVRFQFNGKPLSGFGGDSLASALLANGVRVVGRSFKFHRPRGVFTCGFEEPNALVQLGSGARTVPSARSTLIELYEGLEAFVPSGWPILSFDFGRVLDFVAPLWAAGFYNKTFIWPRWHTYEGLIRHMAGFGHAPSEGDPDRYDTCNAHCDVLVIGGGPSGLQAASAAIASGARVMLAEQGTELGGRARWDGSQIDGLAGTSWVNAIAERLAQAPNTRILTRTTAIGYYDRDVVTLLERTPFDGTPRAGPRERYWIVRAKRVVLATGEIEQPLIFCNNDRPGIMLAGAAHEYLHRYGVAVGRRVLIATNNDSAYGLARDLREAGVEVLALADSRHDVPREQIAELTSLAIPLLAGSIPVDTNGFARLAGVSIGRLSPDLNGIESVHRYSCDALAVSGGWNPSLHLYSQATGKLRYDAQTHALEPVANHSVVTLSRSGPQTDVGIRVSPVGSTQRQWVDLRHDVTVSDLELALRENFSSVEHVKRYTTVGMSVDQGKTSNLAAIDIVSRLRNVDPADIGHTTFRPPFVPVTLGAMVGAARGALFSPARRLPMHDWHVANGAVLEDYGEWKRPSVYLRPGESRHDALGREARTVRNRAGLLDGSSLGKIEVHGPDALEFLDRFYINNLKTLTPGRARYGLMLRESGVIFDDGTVVVLAPDRAVITTTSGNASRVFAWLEEWHQCEWPHLRVAMTHVTDQWAVASLAGPCSREILAKLDTDIDLTGAAFPHLGMREGRLLGYATRIYRVSFTGELTYEINVPANAGQVVWDALIEAGQPLGLQPFGLDALTLLRLEKGFLHIGTDTDGTTVPDDVGWGKVAAKKTADFIGKRSLLLPENVRADRLQLIGLSNDSELVTASHLRLRNSNEATDGWVTSGGRAVLTSTPIALAMLRGGRQCVGDQVTVHHAGRVTQAQVVSPPFFDPAGDRLHG